MIETRYKCDGCGNLYESRLRAIDCCPAISEVEICTLCNTEFDFFEETPAFCSCEFKETAPQKYLEQCGQQRMF